MKSRRILLLGAIPALLVGCAVEPDFARPAAPAAAGYHPAPLAAATTGTGGAGGPAVALWGLGGLAFVVGDASWMALLLSTVPHHQQGRVLSLTTTIMALGAPGRLGAGQRRG